jgi:AcrR family transcriptional regulator
LESAGVQAPTLYHHFGDKEGLYVAWAVASLEALGARLQSGLGADSSTEDRLAWMVDSLTNESSPNIIQLLCDVEKMARPSSKEPIIEAFHSCVYEPVLATLMAGVDTSSLGEEPIRRTAAVFLAGATALRWNALLAEPSPESGRWWAKRFLAGFGKR